MLQVQTEGSSSWRLRRAAEGSAWEHCALTQADSRPLREEELGETLLEATLEVRPDRRRAWVGWGSNHEATL